ncbi:MAG: Rab family GTPase [Thermoplasmata archaeon]
MGDQVAKVVLLGDGAVGKTSLMRQFVEQKFDDRYITSIGVNVKKKNLDELDLTLMIWDLYGQKLNTKLHQSNYSGAEGAIIVCDLTRKSTLDNMDHWIKDLYTITGPIPIVVVGNKVDLINDFNTWFSDEESSEQRFNSYMREHHTNVINYYEKVFGKIPEFSMVKEKDLLRWTDEMKEKYDIEIPCFLSSAKTGENVEKTFLTLGKKVKNNMKEL